MDEATRLPVKTEKRAPVAAPAQWMPFESLRREIDRVFNSFRLSTRDFPFRRALGLESPCRREANLGIAPAFDVAEKDKVYEITAVLPGMDEKNIEVNVVNGVLIIKGEEKQGEKEEKKKDYYLRERSFGSFQRAFQVPDGVVDKIESHEARADQQIVGRQPGAQPLGDQALEEPVGGFLEGLFVIARDRLLARNGDAVRRDLERRRHPDLNARRIVFEPQRRDAADRDAAQLDRGADRQPVQRAGEGYLVEDAHRIGRTKDGHGAG